MGTTTPASDKRHGNRRTYEVDEISYPEPIQRTVWAAMGDTERTMEICRRSAYLINHPITSEIDPGSTNIGSWEPTPMASLPQSFVNRIYGLDTEIRKAVWTYTQSDTGSINGSLMNPTGYPSDSDPPAIIENPELYRQMDAAIRGSYLEQPITVVRGIRDYPFTYTDLKKRIGGTEIWRGYSSCTTSIGIAKEYSEEGDRPEEERFIFHLKIPAGKGTCLCINRHSRFPDEFEIVLRRGAVIRFTSIVRIAEKPGFTVHVYGAMER